tara:strand:+ start:10500 stop:11213 length:714 start_codon:yes stop_codon:yes gene_type:complete
MASTKKQSYPINVGIIMDGNGRWARKNTFAITRGHQQGIKVVRQIVEESVERRLSSLTIYAFSTENWSRPKQEISGIKKLIIQAIDEQVPDLVEQRVKLNFFGDIESFGQDVIQKTNAAMHETSCDNPVLNLNVAIGYGGRADIIQAVTRIVSDSKKHKLDFNEESFFNYLRAPVKDLDLLIRTGGDKRISNFMLYHLAYTELCFLETLWPDFSREEFSECLKIFNSRERRFGKRIL